MTKTGQFPLMNPIEIKERSYTMCSVNSEFEV